MTKLAEEIVDRYGQEALDLVLLVYLNFYYSELRIIDLCGRWMPRRQEFDEKAYLVFHAYDEVKHAKMFRRGVERLGLDWDDLDHSRYMVDDIGERFTKLYESDDEVEVLIGLNLYAEGVLALEEIYQLAHTKPEYFPDFPEIYRDEMTHVAFGVKVAKRLVEQSPEARARAENHYAWYRDHLDQYLSNELASKIEHAASLGFVSPDYIDCTRHRFDDVMGRLGFAPAYAGTQTYHAVK